jgi:predicted transposase/invertase (TIGR01784 family)
MSKSRVLVSFDWAIKRLLRNKANFDILEGFLSELLNRQLIIKQILESESNQETAGLKYNRVDVLVEDETGELIIIELQYEYEIDYFLRMLFGTSKVITEHISKGKKYGTIKKVYSINIVYFDLGEGTDYVYKGTTEFIGIHDGNILKLSDLQRKEYLKTEVSDLFPEYYILNIRHFNDIAKTTLDEWIYYLKNNKIEDNFKAQGLDKARKLLIYDDLTPNEKLIYDKEEDDKLGFEHAFYSSRKLGKHEGVKEGIEIGLKKGIKKGMKKGIEKGIEKGMVKGRKEGIKEGIEKGMEKGIEKGIEKGVEENNIQVVLESKKAGLPLDTIATITKLTLGQVSKILKQYKDKL